MENQKDTGLTKTVMGLVMAGVVAGETLFGYIPTIDLIRQGYSRQEIEQNPQAQLEQNMGKWLFKKLTSPGRYVAYAFDELGMFDHDSPKKIGGYAAGN